MTFQDKDLPLIIDLLKHNIRYSFLAGDNNTMKIISRIETYYRNDKYELKSSEVPELVNYSLSKSLINKIS